jgi:hypothetical protein
MRSGVNWIRENWSSSAWARLWTRRVLPRPRDADEEAVAAREEADEEEVEEGALADDPAVELLQEALAAQREGGEGGAVVGEGVVHGLGCGYTSGGPRRAGGGGGGSCFARRVT